MASHESQLVPIIQSAQVTATRYTSIATVEQFEDAARDLRGVQALKDKIVAFFAPMKSAAHKAHRAVCDREKEHVEPVERAEASIKSAMIVFKRKADADAAAERARLEAQARKEAEDAALAQAVALEELALATGDTSLLTAANDVLATPANVTLAPVVESTPKVAGLSFSKRKRAEVFDLKALCIAIGRGDVPTDAVEPNLKWLTSMAKNLGANMRYPGVKVVDDEGVTSRRSSSRFVDVDQTGAHDDLPGPEEFS